MVDDKDVELILEGLTTIIGNIQKLVNESNRTQYQETIFFPFEKHTDRSRASLIINIQYRDDCAFPGERMKVMQE